MEQDTQSHAILQPTQDVCVHQELQAHPHLLLGEFPFPFNPYPHPYPQPELPYPQQHLKVTVRQAVNIKYNSRHSIIISGFVCI